MTILNRKFKSGSMMIAMAKIVVRCESLMNQLTSLHRTHQNVYPCLNQVKIERSRMTRPAPPHHLIKSI